MAQTPEFAPPSWLSEQDAATIQARMLQSLPPDIDDMEGGFAWDFTMAVALEKSEMLEFHLVETLKLMFPAWSYGDWLDYHARAAGLTRKAANPAAGILTVTGIPGTVIPAGFRFAAPAVGSQPAVEFMTLAEAVLPEGGEMQLTVQAVVAGPAGNVASGTVSLMSTPLKGISAVTNAGPMTGGTEEEDDNSLRDRIIELDRDREASFVGCDADYKRWAEEVSGVGKAVVIPEWDGANTVKLVIVDANGQPANDVMLEAVYEHIMSTDDRLQRKAPIGALLTVVAPEALELNFSFALELRDGATKEGVVEQFSAQLDEYYPQAKDELEVRYTQIAALLSATPGVKDYAQFTINGAAENIALGVDEYPVTGEIAVTVMEARR